MGRPRHGRGLKRPVTLTLSEEAIAVLDEHRCPSRSLAAEALILGHAPASPDPGPDSGRTLECTHPKANEVKHSWGTQCGLCKKRLR